VWDLYSNQVVPWWIARQYPWAISHAWMDKKDRMNMLTPINGNKWPVPMPRDADLDLIRIKMLNHGAEYAWLDVLCLRQKRKRENRPHRLAEWELDVSTIGRVYEMADSNQLVCYLSGLGRPFSLEKNNLKSQTCWFRRAWTLQEVNKAVIIGGETGDDRFIEEEMRRWVDKELSSLQESIDPGRVGIPVFTALLKMQKRVSANPVDKVAGLAYLLRTDEIPPYSAA
ncbi:hypothetical protein ARMSODRAFT_899878, partial [Armillaria solidipes]